MNTYKTLIVVSVISALAIFGCSSVEISRKANLDASTDCNILDSTVNITNGTITSNSIFSSRMYDLYYFGYNTDEYAPLITKQGSHETLWFTSTRIYQTPQTYGFWDYFPIGWLFGSTPDPKIKNPVLYPKYRKIITDKYNLADVFYSERDNPNGSLKPWEGWSKPEIWKTQDYKFDNYIRGTLTTANGSDFIVAADRNTSVNKSNGVSKYMYLYEISKTSGGYGSPALIQFPGSDSQWVSQPALSLSGDILYCVSDKPGGKGRFDIWYSQKINGAWDTLRPLTSINSEFDDEYPHCGSDGRFYFSSNRPGGDGGFNIYTADFDKNVLWKNPQNINGFSYTQSGMKITFPSTINTNGDEISPFISPDSNSIYYAKKNAVSNDFDLFACKIKHEIDTTPPTIILRIKVLIKDKCSPNEEKITSKADTLKLVEVMLSGGADTTLHHGDIDTLKRNTNYTLSVKNPRFKCNPVYITTLDHSAVIDTTMECDVVGSHLGTIIFSDESGIPYFITGYWRPLTSDNWNIYNQEKGRLQLKNSCADGSDYCYSEVPKYIDSVFQKNLYQDIANILPLLQLKEYVCEDSLLLKITIDGYTDSCGLSDCEYTGKTDTINDWIVPHGQSFHSSTLRDTNNKVVRLKDGGQTGNIILSTLRAYYTQQTIHNYMKSNNAYKIAFDSGKIEYEVNGKGIYDKSALAPEYHGKLNLCNFKKVRKDRCNNPLMRRIEIFLDAVAPDFNIEKQQNVKDIVSYIVEINLPGKKDAEALKQLLEIYSGGSFNLTVNESFLKLGTFGLISENFESESDVNTLVKNIQKTIDTIPILKKVKPEIITDSNRYVVSLGAFKTEENAVKYWQKVRSVQGVEFEKQKIVDNGTKYSIRTTKKYRNYNEAEINFDRIKKILKDNKIPSFLSIIKLG